MTLKDRKQDHIELALGATTSLSQKDERFYYEPLLSTFPDKTVMPHGYFLGKPYKAPFWISSMTGGTEMARHINENLARAAGEFGFGMGLGSCRTLLESDDFLKDFNVRRWMKDQTLYANLGIAQVINLIEQNKTESILRLLDKLSADGLIIHVNPIQEWLQPEGDLIRSYSAYQAIEYVLEHLNISIIVKEVGQGMGPESIRSLLSLPIKALEFGAFGGTNFALIESIRKNDEDQPDPLIYVGHSPIEMIGFIHDIPKSAEIEAKDFIISGGVRNYLDGYYYRSIFNYNSVIGQAGAFLRHARGSYDDLAAYVEAQIEGYKFAMRYLRVKSI